MKMHRLQSRHLLWRILLGFLLVVLLALVLVDVFDTRLFRAVVAPRIEAALGRTVQVDRLDLQWGLPIKVEIQNLRIASAQWARTESMLHIPEMTLASEPAQLLSGPPYAHAALQNASVVLETSASGELNWQFAERAKEEADQSGSEQQLPLTLRAEGGQVQYYDHRDDVGYTLPLTLATLQAGEAQSGSSEAQSIAATLQASYQDLPISISSTLRRPSDAWLADANVRIGASDLSGSVELNTSMMPLQVNADLHSDLLDVDQLSAALPSTPTDATPPAIELAVLERIAADTRLEIAELRLAGRVFNDAFITASIDAARFAADLGIELDGAVLGGSMQLDASVPDPVLQAQLNLQESATAPLLAELGLPGVAGEVSSQITAELHPHNGTLQLSGPNALANLALPQARLHFTSDAMTLVVQGEIPAAGGAPQISAELEGAGPARLTASASAPPLRQLTTDTWPVQAAVTAPEAEASLRMNLGSAFTDAGLVLDFTVSGTALPALPAFGFAPPALPEFSLAGELHKVDAGWSIPEAELALGESRVTGQLTWQPQQQPPYLRASIDASLIDLESVPDITDMESGTDPLTALEQATADAPAQANAQGLLPDLLTALNMDLSMNVAELRFPQGFSLTDLQLQAELADGRLQVEPLGFSTEAGGLEGSLTADAARLPTQVELLLNFDALRLNRLVPELSAVAELSGPVSGDLQLSFAEQPLERDMETLALPTLGRIALERSVLNLRTPQGDTRLALELTGTDTPPDADIDTGTDAFDDAGRGDTAPDASNSAGRGIRLAVEGSLRGTPVEGSIHGDSVLALRNTGTPYAWNLDLNAADATLRIDGRLLTSSSPPAVELSFSAQQQDSSGLSQLAAPWLPAAIPAALPPLDVEGRLNYAEGDISVQNLNAQLGGSDLSGSFSVNSSVGGISSVSAMLHSTQLDLSELQELLTATSEASTSEADAASDADSETVLPQQQLDLAFLSALDADIAYTVEDLYLAEAALGSLELGFTARQGQLLLDPLYVEIADGSLRIQGDIDARQSGLEGSVQAEMQRLNLAALFRESSLVKDSFGRLGGQARFWLRGDSPATLLGSLDGGVMLMLDGGRIDPVIVEGAGLDIGEALLAAAGIGSAVPVNCAYASAYAREGTLSMDRVVVDTEDSTFYLAGSVDLEQETLDLALHNESKDLALLASSSPVGLQGTFSNPEIEVLTEELAIDALQSAALAALAAPAAALLAFVDTDTEDETPTVCRGWVEGLQEVL